MGIFLLFCFYHPTSSCHSSVTGTVELRQESHSSQSHLERLSVKASCPLCSGLMTYLYHPNTGSCYPGLLKLWFQVSVSALPAVLWAISYSSPIFFSSVIESTSVACNQIIGLTHVHSFFRASSKFCCLINRKDNIYVAGSRKKGLISLNQALSISLVSNTFFIPCTQLPSPGRTFPILYWSCQTYRCCTLSKSRAGTWAIFGLPWEHRRSLLCSSWPRRV